MPSEKTLSDEPVLSKSDVPSNSSRELNEVSDFVLSPRQHKIIENALNVINTLCQSRGAPIISLLSLILPKDVNEEKNKISINGNMIYDYDKKTVNLLYALLNELDVINDQLIKQGALIDDKERSQLLWRAQLSKNEAELLSYSKEVNNLNSRIVKLQVELTDFKTKKTASDNKVRELTTSLKLVKEQRNVERKLHSNEKESLLRRLNERRANKKVKSLHNGQFTERLCLKGINGQGLLSENLSKKIEGMAIENANLEKKIDEHYGFLNNLYNCLLEQQDTAGMALVRPSFLPQEKAKFYLRDEDKSLLLFDSKFNSLIKSIQKEPVGLDDTFKFHRAGAEKHKEVRKLKQDLEDLSDKYEKALQELDKIKQSSSFQ